MQKTMSTGRPQSVVPVQSKSGRPLMPCKPAKARKLLKSGKAEKRWSRLGIFYIQLAFEPKSPNQNQLVCLGLDPGSMFEGVAVTTKKQALTAGMTELPRGITRKIKQRRRLRHFRRYRKCRRRPCRFSNRRRREAWIAPSQKAKVDFRLKIVAELAKLYPVTDYAVEDVRFDHYRKRWGKHFSTVEIGKTQTYATLENRGKLHLFAGVETADLRKRLGLKKVSDKGRRCFGSHAADALAIAVNVADTEKRTIPPFHVWRRYQNHRRKLHKVQFKRGKRCREGGSSSLPPFKKNDVVMYRGRLARVGGFMSGKLSLHRFDSDNKRFKQNADPTECTRLFNQQLMSSTPPTTKARGLP